MPNLLKRLYFIDGAVQRIAAWGAFFGIVVAVFGAAVVSMTWITNSITALAAYGWGLPVLVAIGIVLALLLVLSFTAIAWRYFNPLLSPLPVTINAKTNELDIGRVERKLEVLEINLEQQDRELASSIGRLNQFHSELAETFSGQSTELQKKLNALQLVVTALDERLSTHGQVVANGTRLLIRALRARDAMREILKPNDETAMSLGKRLMYPEAYSDALQWLADYQVWNKALTTIDHLMIGWANAERSSYTSLFDLKRYHYERAPMPPENIRSDDTIIPFKTVCNVQSIYANQRDGLFAFFDERAVYPG
ncbi:MAG: hypothetical protein WAU57_11065 [Xanthobacteraceae bacterium]